MALDAELTKALEHVALTDKDKATVALAHHYATSLDAGADPIKMGPAYLSCLESLGMTPRARAAITGKGEPASAPAGNPLQLVRGNRAARQHGATVVDLPSP